MKNATLVYQSIKYAHIPSTVLSSDDPEQQESIEDTIIKKYIWLLNKRQEKLDNAALFLYGKKAEIPENGIGKAFLQLTMLEKRADKSIEFIGKKIKDSVGEMYFFNEGNPIAIAQIMNAYKAVCKNASRKDVWNCLVN